MTKPKPKKKELSNGLSIIRRRIPLFKPSYGREEETALQECLRSNWTGLGPKTEEFENKLAERLGVKFVVATSSGTSALHMALRAVVGTPGIQYEIVTSPLTFASTAAVALYEGHSVRFVDINARTLNMDFDLVARQFTGSGYHRVLMPVLYGGYADDSPWESLGVPIIYDCAHAMGSSFDARGKICCWSFHTVKNLSCGEGGAVTTDDPKLAEKLRRWRWLGIDKSTHERSTGSYRWDYDIPEYGFKYHMSDLNAALGIVQLNKLDKLQHRRYRIASRYLKMLGRLDNIVLPAPSVIAGNSWHLFYVLAHQRDELMTHLAKNGIATGVHYKPLYLHKAFAHCLHDCPTADFVWKCLISLPMFPDLMELEQDFIVSKIKEFYA